MDTVKDDGPGELLEEQSPYSDPGGVGICWRAMGSCTSGKLNHSFSRASADIISVNESASLVVDGKKAMKECGDRKSVV